MPLDVPLPLDYANAEDFFLHEASAFATTRPCIQSPHLYAGRLVGARALVEISHGDFVWVERGATAAMQREALRTEPLVKAGRAT
eukprot:6208694-Pleurochrysis_carterae.AAC.3